MYDKPLSYSGLSLYRKCPLRWADVYIEGNRQPSGPAAARGVKLHEMLEDYFNGKIPFPSGNKVLAPWQKFMEGLLALSPVAEGEVAVDKEWNPCGFGDSHAFFRGKKDLEIEGGDSLILLDWKSGKAYDDHHAQGKAYTALSPGFEKYKVGFVYLDQPLLIKWWEYDAQDWELFRDNLREEIEAVRSATEFPATPSDDCRWCPLSWRNGGKCTRAR